jgi:hypothetical protein
MKELRVPTIALGADVFCSDGRSFRGRIFVPAVAPRHTGATRPAEWINDPAAFFPFLPDDAAAPVILNKHELVALTVAAATDSEDPTELRVPERRLVVECGDRRFEGQVFIDMPEDHSRVLDYLNRPDPFLVLRDRERHHLVRKERITRVVEKSEP